jgi:hypothetical protein
MPKTVKDIIWDRLICEEASMFSHEIYIQCGQPAVAIIWHNKDRRSYAMCEACADNNVRNRNGIELTRKGEETEKLPIKDEYDFGKERQILRSFLRKFISKYLEKPEKMSEDDLDNFLTNPKSKEVLISSITGEYKI